SALRKYMDYRVTRLENGLQLVTAPMPGMYSVTVSVFVGVGSRYELMADAGSAHLIEHMLFKGTQRRPSAEAISETIERVGGMMNAATDKEQTVYWVKVARDRLDVATDLLADMLLHSMFERSEVEKERRVVIEELTMSIDSPQDWVHSLIDEICWPDSPLGRDVAGTRESVARLTRDGLLRFKEGSYLPENVVVSIAGGIDHDQARAVVAETFGTWRLPARGQGAALPVAEPSLYQATNPTLRYEERSTEQVNMCLAVAGVSRVSADRYAFDLLTAILGGAMSSRLFLELRERRGLAYDVHSYSNKLAETGSMVTYLAVEPDNGLQVVEEVARQLDRLRREPVSQDELDKVKDAYKGRLLLGLEDTQSVAGWCGVQQQLYGVIRQPEAVCAEIDRVRPEDVQRLAVECFRDQYLRLAALGPAGGERGLVDALHL
ncbi:MAG TPA: pitrilysin family protein, partial [Chloroflexota bacterium]|nr:pitrilysin family protein [Chloroflexota bacterium]